MCSDRRPRACTTSPACWPAPHMALTHGALSLTHLNPCRQVRSLSYTRYRYRQFDIYQVRDHSFFGRGDLKHKVGSQQPSLHNSCTPADRCDEIDISPTRIDITMSTSTHDDTHTKIAISIKVSDLQQKEKAGRNKTTEMGGQPTSAFT